MWQADLNAARRGGTGCLPSAHQQQASLRLAALCDVNMAPLHADRQGTHR